MLIPRLKYVSNKRLKQIESNRNTEAYRKWRKTVLERDQHCRYPGCTCSDKLEIHHIKPFANNRALRTDPNNGITLCKTHHSKIFSQEDKYALLFMEIVLALVKNGPTKES